jgi:hypothetical protein
MLGLKAKVSNRAFEILPVIRCLVDKNDRICWIDSRSIKRSCVLVLDGSLVPFFSKCLDACMRANNVLKKFEKDLKFES